MTRRTNKSLIRKLIPDTVGESFLISAVERYSKEILSDSTEWGDKALINQDLWRIIAKHNLELIKEHYK